MIVIMDMTTGEWAMDHAPEDDFRAAAPRTLEPAAEPRLALREVCAETRRAPSLPYTFPTDAAALRLFART